MGKIKKTIDFGKAIKGYGKAYKEAKKNIFSKFSKSKKKTPGEEHFDSVYKTSKDTPKIDRKIESMNKYLKRTGRSASPAMVDKYHKLMTSGSKYTEKFFKDKK